MSASFGKPRGQVIKPGQPGDEYALPGDEMLNTSYSPLMSFFASYITLVSGAAVRPIILVNLLSP